MVLVNLRSARARASGGSGAGPSYKTRLISDAQIKTDRLDAHALGALLRGNLVVRAHVPRHETRIWKIEWGKDAAGLQRLMHALMQMKKIDIATLEKAYEHA